MDTLQVDYQIKRTDAFATWLRDIRDPVARARILIRLDRARLGNLGDVRSVGRGILEMRIHWGPGYRLYFARPQPGVIQLLCGGDKSTQARNIAEARRLVAALHWDETNEQAD
jgi:putative addiction module killer protein